MEEYKLKQRTWHDSHYKTYAPPLIKAGYAEFFYRTFELQVALDLLRGAGFPESQKPLRILLSCSGGAEGLLFWCSQLSIGEVYGIDLSFEACRLARRLVGDGFRCSWFLQADAEALPFADNSFDLAIVHNGLHHLTNPAAGLRELWRVSRHAVVVIEPANTRLMPLFIRLGIARNTEESGNMVLRFKKRDFLSFLNQDPQAKIYYRRYLWYEQSYFCEHVLPRLNYPTGLLLLRVALAVLNHFFFFFRTKSAAVITKPWRGVPAL